MALGPKPDETSRPSGIVGAPKKVPMSGSHILSMATCSDT